jgi:hypothetical protein
MPGLKLSDDQDFENGLVQVIADVQALLDVDFSLGFYDDSPNTPQAKAVSDKRLATRRGVSPRDGGVGIGRNLIRSLDPNSAGFSAALTALVAHEAGHILQFKHIYVFDRFAKYVEYDIARELHADFICGFYGFHRRKRDEKYPAVLQAKTLYVRGDGELVAVSHGTYEQRGNAVRAGYIAGLKGITDIKDLIEEGVKSIDGLGLVIQT